MQSAGKTDDAFRALKEFADLSPNNEEIRLLLAEQLKGAARTAEAREQLAKLFAEAEATGDKRRSRQTLLNIKAIDPDFDPTKGPKTKLKQKPQKSSDLVFLDLDEEYRTDQAGEAVAEEPEEEVVIEPTALVEEAAAPADEAILIEPSRRVSDVTAMTDDLGLLEGLEVREEFAGEEATAAPGLEIERTSLVEERNRRKHPEGEARRVAQSRRAEPPSARRSRCGSGSGSSSWTRPPRSPGSGCQPWRRRSPSGRPPRPPGVVPGAIGHRPSSG
jgi:hypothetical protein